jgi:putrescine aminotransferase
MNRDQLIDACGRHWNPSAALMYRLAHRSVESHASGACVFDEDGRRYLDFACSYGVFIVGHCNPAVQARVLAQVGQAPAAPYGAAHPTCAAFMRKLASMLPGDLSRVFFANSGAEVSEMTMRAVLAAQAPRRRIVVIRNSYHGKTLGALNLLGQEGHRQPFLPLMDDVVFVPFGDIAAMRKAVGEGAAAVFLEPILGGPFLQTPPAGYVPSTAELCQRTGTLLVADEIQTAFGRCGRMFAIDEYPNVRPDVVLLSKGITGGHSSMAVAVFSETLVQRIDAIPGLPARFLASDSGGSPFACAAGLAAIEYIESNALHERAQVLGTRLLAGLRRVAERYPALVLDAPGTALMSGLKVRNPAVETAIAAGLSRLGVHAGHSLNEKAPHPVLRFYPPLTVTNEEIDEVLHALDLVMNGLSRRAIWTFDVSDQLVRRLYQLPPQLLYKLAGVKPN